jgi:hypothetical protein
MFATPSNFAVTSFEVNAAFSGAFLPPNVSSGLREKKSSLRSRPLVLAIKTAPIGLDSFGQPISAVTPSKR